jgi:hypothetical protein
MVLIFAPFNAAAVPFSSQRNPRNSGDGKRCIVSCTWEAYRNGAKIRAVWDGSSSQRTAGFSPALVASLFVPLLCIPNRSPFRRRPWSGTGRFARMTGGTEHPPEQAESFFLPWRRKGMLNKLFRRQLFRVSHGLDLPT